MNGNTFESDFPNARNESNSSFIRLMKYSLKHKLLLVVGNFSLLVTSLSMVALPYLIG